MNEEAFARLLEAAKNMSCMLGAEFCGGCPSLLTEPWKELDEAIIAIDPSFEDE